jgi:small ligand-binding sensory domain FIST
MSARAATSFLARGESPAHAARAFVEASRGIGRPSGALLFVCGELAQRLEELGERLQRALGPLPVLVVGGHGVLTERGEVEGESAAAGLIWQGGQSDVLTVGNGGGTDLGLALAGALESRVTPTTTAFVFVRPKGMAPHALDPLKSLRCAAIAGGGTAGDDNVLALGSGGKAKPAAAGALLLRGVAPPVMRSSPACRLITPLMRITAARGPMILEIEGSQALEVLSTAAGGLTDQPLVFVVLAPEAEGDEDDASVPLLLRGIQGVDPVREGIVVSEEVRPGLRMGFAIRDAAAARIDLEAAAARVWRDTAGSAPRFGIYMNCAGRGTSLYGAPDVDTRILRARFPDLPLVGMSSSFEVAPHEGAPTVQLYTGVFSLFTNPS